MSGKSVYHQGELEVQERAGEASIARRTGGVISDSIPARALAFIEQQSLAAAGSVDSRGDVWASLLVGRPGFLSAPDTRTVEVDLSGEPLGPHDALWENIQHDPRLGLLVIDLSNRRRLRVNGSVRRVDGRLRVEVEEAYPNCPKYIQRRHPKLGERAGESAKEVRWGSSLGGKQVEMIRAADTLFVASQHPGRGVDASHRGGMPGFVEVLDGRILRVPDYAGNSMFNTMGNFAVNPRGGVAFLDFEQGVILQLTGRVDLLWDEESSDTGRAWEMSVERWVETRLGRRVEWEFLDYSPFNPGG